MQLIEYTPDVFDSLRATAERLRVRSLCHRPFVDYYYTGNPWCRLHLLKSGDGSITGTIGTDQMTFAAGERTLNLAFASNFHAAQPGAGGYLYLHWMKTSPYGLVFGGSENTHKILRQQRWHYFPGVRTYVLNRSCSVRPGDPVWRRWAKRVAASLRRKRPGKLLGRMLPELRTTVSVQEEQHFTGDMLPASSPFAFRFAPSLEYLAWRYRTGLSFVRYRLFRIRTEERTCGYVVLKDSRRKLLVAQCDGEDPVALACGVLLSIVAATAQDARIREVLLTSSHPAMQQLYQDFGFRPRTDDQPFAIGSRQGPVELPADTAHWSINYDWGDNGLRVPFLDQTRPARRIHDSVLKRIKGLRSGGGHG